MKLYQSLNPLICYDNAVRILLKGEEILMSTREIHAIPPDVSPPPEPPAAVTFDVKDLASLPEFAAFVKAIRAEGLAVYITAENDPIKNEPRVNFTWNGFFRAIGINPDK